MFLKKMLSKKSIKKFIFVLVCLGIVSVLVPVYSKGIIEKFSKPKGNLVAEAGSTSNLNASEVDEIAKEKFLSDVGQVYDFVKQQYYQELKDEDILEGAIYGLMNNLGDPYSTYIDREDSKEFRENIQGTFGGLGIFIDEGLDEITGVHYIKVISPIEGTPAYYVGMKSGDLILGVDDQSTAEMSSEDAVKIMRGKPGSKVTLTVKRNNKIFKVNLIRDIIKTVDLRSGFIDDDIAYIKILRFTQQTPEAFEKAVKKFDKEGDYQTLIIDVRDNPGGSLQAVLETANFLLGEGKLLVGTESRIPGEVREYTSTKEQLVGDDKQIVVMINGGSASASEILSGAVKDNSRGVLVGETTFGKGLVQTVRDYKGGIVKMTISQYYTPSHTFIDKVGIDPDVEIQDNSTELSPEELIHTSDMQDQDIVRLFVEKKKGILTDESVEEFKKELDVKGLTINNTEFLRRVLYISKNAYLNVIPAYSLEIDSVLSQTVKKIRNSEFN